MPEKVPVLGHEHGVHEGGGHLGEGDDRPVLELRAEHGPEALGLESHRGHGRPVGGSSALTRPPENRTDRKPSNPGNAPEPQPHGEGAARVG